jgi:hypothetical protein
MDPRRQSFWTVAAIVAKKRLKKARLRISVGLYFFADGHVDGGYHYNYIVGFIGAFVYAGKIIRGRMRCDGIRGRGNAQKTRKEEFSPF